ncbi:hypothetical protein LINPERPRIM_LOCUS41066 [Linum perenne]
MSWLEEELFPSTPGKSRSTDLTANSIDASPPPVRCSYGRSSWSPLLLHIGASRASSIQGTGTSPPPGEGSSERSRSITLLSL